MAEISVVILNWNGKPLLEKFLPGVLSHSSRPGCEVVVADNGSTDGSAEMLKERFPEVRLILFDKNYGFTGGYNRALAQLDSKYCILLNSDVEIKSEWIEPMFALLEHDPSIAAVQPKILSQQLPEKFDYAGASGGFIDRYGFPFCRGRVLFTIEQDSGQYDDPREVFWASGAAMMVRMSVYRELGGLDEDFFAHMEEVDFCWRAKNKGYRIMVDPRSVVYHMGGGTLSANSPFKLYLNYRNSLLMLRKNLPQKELQEVLFKRRLIDGMLGLVYCCGFKFSYFSAVLKAHRDYRAACAAFDTKRMQSAHPDHPQRMKKLLLWQYLLGKKRFSDYIL